MKLTPADRSWSEISLYSTVSETFIKAGFMRRSGMGEKSSHVPRLKPRLHRLTRWRIIPSIHAQEMEARGKNDRVVVVMGARIKYEFTVGPIKARVRGWLLSSRLFKLPLRRSRVRLAFGSTLQFWAPRGRLQSGHAINNHYGGWLGLGGHSGL